MQIYLLNDLIVFIFIEAILVTLLLISEYSVLKILKNWDFSLTTSAQFWLEKRNYLVNTIIIFAVISKIILFVFFIKSLAELSNVVPGAMCVAGVISANDYGEFLLLFKIFIVFMLAIWLVVNRLDLEAKDFPFIKHKYIFFNFLLFFVLIELVLEIVFFNAIPLKVPVFCCSSLFKSESIPFGLEGFYLLGIFYFIFTCSIIFAYYKKIILSFISNILFLFVSYFAVTYFFAIYIYVLPNHQCPFCILQKEYYYIGYFIWISLFLGIYFGITPYVVESITKKQDTRFFKYSILFNTIFVLLCSYPFVSYYIKNGVFL